MSYVVEFTPTGLSSLEELTSTIQERILQKVCWLSERVFEKSDD